VFVTNILTQHGINNPSGYWSSRKYSTYRARVKLHCLSIKIGQLHVHYKVYICTFYWTHMYGSSFFLVLRLISSAQ